MTARARASAPPLPACLSGPRSTQLLVELAHDLRSPLTSMLVLAESLLSGSSGPLSPAQEQQIRLLYTAALRLCETTSATLELAREHTAPAEEKTTFAVARVVDDVRLTVLPMAEEKGVRIETDVDVAEVRSGALRAPFNGVARPRRHPHERHPRTLVSGLRVKGPNGGSRRVFDPFWH